MSEKKYKLLKDLPNCKAGVLFTVIKDTIGNEHPLYAPEHHSYICLYLHQMTSEWFEEVVELPKRWQDLQNISGWIINNGRPVYVENTGCHNVCTSHIYATKAQAKSAVAFAKLSQLVEVWNEGWKPDFTDVTTRNYYVAPDKNILQVSHTGTFNKQLCYRSYEVAKKSLELHRDLWEDYWMISKQED